MREPKFSDAPCYGKDFDPKSKACAVCLAQKLCQPKSQRVAQQRNLAILGTGLTVFRHAQPAFAGIKKI